MLLVTTMSYDQLGALIRNKSVSLNNDSLILGQSSDAFHKYLTDRLGGPGYVVGIRGRINDTSVRLLKQLDRGLAGNKVILEAPVDEDEVLAFTVQGLEEAIQILTYGLPDEILYDHLDNVQVKAGQSGGVDIICIPDIKKSGNIRITSLNKEIQMEADGITFVKLPGVQP